MISIIMGKLIFYVLCKGLHNNCKKKFRDLADIGIVDTPLIFKIFKFTSLSRFKICKIITRIITCYSCFLIINFNNNTNKLPKRLIRNLSENRSGYTDQKSSSLRILLSVLNHRMNFI